MWKNILVPVAGSEFSEQALPMAVSLAQRLGATLHVVSVDKSNASSLQHEWNRQIQEDYLRQITVRIEAESRVHTEAAVLSGEIAQAIDNYSRNADISLIVMNTRTRAGQTRFWTDSVAERVVAHSLAPVLLLRLGPGSAAQLATGTPAHMLVALDGSSESEMILDPALTLAGLAGARLTLLHVVATDLPTTYAAIVQSQIDNEVDRISQLESLDYLDSVSARTVRWHLPVDTMVIRNTVPADGIAAAAVRCGADCIAMATHGRVGWQRFAKGSVEAAVLARTTMPMLVQRVAWQPAFSAV